MDDLTADLLQSLVTNRVAESDRLEYKRELPGTRAKDHRDYLGDVTAFANLAGGLILYGDSEPDVIDRDDLLVTETMIGSFPERGGKMDSLLRPQFDAVWQAVGLTRSRKFNTDGLHEDRPWR